MDNPISWAILLILAIAAAFWFWQKCEKELQQNQKENDQFFQDFGR